MDPEAEGAYGHSPYNSMWNNPVTFSDPDGDFAFAPILIGMAIGATVHTGVHLATNDFTFDNWNWGSFAGSVVAGGVGGGVSSALAKAGIGGFAGGAITGGASGFSQNLTSGLINGDLTGGVLAKSTLLGAGIGGLIGGIDATIKGNRFWDGRSKVLTERYQLATGNTPTTEESPNQISGQRPMSKGDAIERGEVGLMGNDRSVDRLGTDINRGFEGDLRLRGNAYVPEGQEFYVNVDGVDVVNTKVGMRIDLITKGKHISWGFRGTAIQQTTTQNGLTIGVTVRPNSYLYITGNHRGWDGFLFWGR